MLLKVFSRDSNDRPVESHPVDRQEPKQIKPRIGLALGGGAARGWAHIGILRTLNKAGIKPDVIAGTSMGALAGGAWAANRLDELEDFARSMTKRRMFGFLDWRIGGNGLISGRRLANILSLNFGETSIEDLPLRYAAIATELSSGHEIWLTRGNLIQSMRASYALPGIFTPIKIGGRWLVDGALVNPIPVSAARALGARVVIAVNLHSDVFGKGTVIQNNGSDEPDAVSLPQPAEAPRGVVRRMFGMKPRVSSPADDGPRGISRVMMHAFNITQDRISRSRLAGDPPDVMISPRLNNVGLFEFYRAEESIKAGEEAAERALGDIMETVARLSA
ncbi:MAG: patatin-like phospholipase family protein [Xanthobacteraceae bacterium]|nr:patatin-like phospholipase family protein [Xanthobacteraceae bacterium]QYK43962.1 MAG: patatin-like phospholipase family protein [Xanthobacteraceae bacterium]HMN51807.1 patatin-like phospholipase family protein [Xanthobacteraceae bacterium]